MQLDFETMKFRIFGVFLQMTVLAACAGRSSDIAPDGCAQYSSDQSLDADALANLVGTFDIVLSATEGERSGQTTSGQITFRSNTDDLRLMSDGVGGFLENVTVPYYGTSNIDMVSVGALALGGGQSDNPSQPGVLVVQANGADGSPTSVVMRIGVDANQRDAVRFDGGYTVLRLHHATRDTIAGTWASGGVSETASGCWLGVKRGGAE